MTNSILNSTKKQLDIAPDYTAFDMNVITAINAGFGTLHQLGIGPAQGFYISDASAEWDSFVTDRTERNMVESYVWLRAKLMFDPPQTSYLIASMERQVKEFEDRLNIHHEFATWVVPVTGLPASLVVDGGNP